MLILFRMIYKSYNPLRIDVASTWVMNIKCRKFALTTDVWWNGVYLKR